jgi:hypothetical protein
MNDFVLDSIPFQIDVSLLMQKLRVDRNKFDSEPIERLVIEAKAVARPKAFYKVVPIEARGDDYVVMEGMKMTSRVLRVNLENEHRVFLYAATCGTELEDWSSSTDDGIQQFWTNEIKGMALSSAIQALDENITTRFNTGPISSMSPGSLDDWPLEEQRGLFALLGDLKGVIGVQLLDNLWMVPSMSVSGIRFPSEDGFESCQLCPREICSERAAQYDEGLYDRKYRIAQV